MWVRSTGATIGISGVLIVVLLVVKFLVGTTLGGGTGTRGEGGVSVGWEVGSKVGPTLGDSVSGEGVVRMEGKGIMGGTVVVGVERRRVGGLFGRRGIT